MQLENGTLLQNRYRIDGVLRREDMGAVYRGTDLTTGSAVVITEHHILSVRLPALADEDMPAEDSMAALSSTEEVRERFEKEAGVLSSLDHPGIPRIRDFFDVPGQGQYLVMDYVPGHDLEEGLLRGERLLEDQLFRIGLDVCEILEYLHGRTPPVIHRDIKPSNIRVTPEGRTVLVGFGVGREQSPGEMTLGAPSISPGFSPLEQYGGDIITDERSDIYALGATLLSLTTGEIPRPATERALARSTEKPVTPAATAAGLSGVLARAMAVLPRDRYQTVADFREALRAVMPSREPAPVATPEPPPVVPEPPKVAAPEPPKVAAPRPPKAAAPEPPKAAVPRPAPVAAPPAPAAQAPPFVAYGKPKAPRFRWLAYPLGAVGVVLLLLVLPRIFRPNPQGTSTVAGEAPDSSGRAGGLSAAADETLTAVAGVTAPPPAVDSAGVSPAAPGATHPDSALAAVTSGLRDEKRKAGSRREGDDEGDASGPPSDGGGSVSAARILPDIGVAATSANVAWTPADGPDFGSYEVYYAQPSNDLVVPVFIRSGKAIRERDRTKLAVPGLRCGTTYAFKVRTVDRKGRFRDSDVVRATTAACAVSDTLLVSTKGDAPYISIEDALAAAARGSDRPKRLLLRPGRYVLNGTVTLDRTVTIAGIGPRANVVVEYGGGSCFVVASRLATFRGLTIRSGRDRAVVVKAEAHFEDCDIASAGTCVDVEPDASVTLRQCRVHDSKETGVRLGSSAEARFDNATIIGNAVGVLVQENARAVLTKSQVLRSRQGNGITVGTYGRALLTGCDVSDNRKSGVALEGGIAEIRDTRINKNRWYAVNCADGNGSVSIDGCTFAGNFPSDVHPLCEKTRRSVLPQ